MGETISPLMTMRLVGWWISVEGMADSSALESVSYTHLNCLRALLGETADSGEEIVELRCNLDDMTPEALGFAQEQLFAGGALDVYTCAVGMKKNRPGVLLSCMCREEQREALLRLLFRHTTTLGVREYRCARYALRRSERILETPYGPVRVKEAQGWGVRLSLIHI